MKQIIMDVDPGIDDSLAILLALRSEKLNVLGITTVSGNVELHQATKNALKAVQMSGKRTPVYKGAELPLVKSYVDATDTHGKDGLGETFYQDIILEHENKHAVDYLIETMNKNPNGVEIVALGPLTNIATAIQKDRTFAGNVKGIVLMGGSARYPGNCSPVAEYNFWVDPHAAQIVFQSGIRITMVGLDVTHKIIFTPNLREIVRQFKTQISQYVYDITQFYVDFHWKQEKTIGCVINDPLAIAYLISPEIMVTKYGYVEVETVGIAIGQSVVEFTKHRTNIEVCMEVNTESFFKVFLHNLFPENIREIDILLGKEFNRREVLEKGNYRF
ncbi:nucleoside hydrolase [Fredinandcohnia humi]